MNTPKINNNYNGEIQNQESKTKDSVIENPTSFIPAENSSTIADTVSISQKFIRSVRQTVYCYNTGYRNQLMSAEEFKHKLRNHENFSSDIYYVVYADLPQEEKVYCIPNISLHAIYEHMFNPYYEGTLDLSDIEITQLPDNLHVKGSVNLSKSNISQLPKNFIVDKNLNVSECPNITEFPEGLHVKGSINAHKSGIATLNSKFTVGDSLNLSECIYICEIPGKPLKVFADINFTGCINIKQIPIWILFIDLMPSNHRMRNIYLHNIGMNSYKIESEIRNFNRNNRLYVKIHY